MIQKVSIRNYKSISDLEIDLGRINVLIGENGCGKSNILEAVAMGCAAAADKLGTEFLRSRGIRVTEPRWMRAAFSVENIDKEIQVDFQSPKGEFLVRLQNDNNKSYSPWYSVSLKELNDKWIDKKIDELVNTETRKDVKSEIRTAVDELIKYKKVISEQFQDQGSELAQFLIYSPENASLRMFEQEGQIEPLGIKGEGLFKFLKYLNTKNKLDEIKEKLHCLGWFEDLEIPGGLLSNERQIKIHDRYLDEKLAFFDQNSANEGFLFLLFYFCLFSSEETPKFFAIDNIDASLNPKLCSDLMSKLAEMAKMQDKQAIITTHNPCILDGINLDDDEQRLFVVYRNSEGHTRVKRILKPQRAEGQDPVPLSVAFIRGYIGGLPKGF